jgi:ABC-2 type transport system ATP-binding protein
VTAAIEVRGLQKRYGAAVAADAMTFSVAAGEIFGLIGRNGAGKTTLVECLATLRRPDAGDVRVLGLDPLRDGRLLRSRIGVQLQRATLPDRLKVREALDLFASFYPKRRPWPHLLARLGLAESADVAFGELSGGQKQRAFVALALVHEPEVVFLDELTTGLDPQARREIWELVRGIREGGATVLLTTHFMEEAERLCDRIAVIRRGRIVALDAPEHLVATAGARRRVSFRVDGTHDSGGHATRDSGGDGAHALGRLGSLPTVRSVRRIDGRIIVEGDGDALVGDVIGALAGSGIRALDLRTEQSSLEDVFLALTGERLEDS